MTTIRCPFCHEHIDAEEFRSHVTKHRKLRPDGQQTEYVTLPPEDRLEGSLDDVPHVYVHTLCGGATGMPEEIIRSYLNDPYMYGADRTFCCTCHIHVPQRECLWEETGENMQTYFDRLRAARPDLKPKGWDQRFMTASTTRFSPALSSAPGCLGGIVMMLAKVLPVSQG